MGYDMRWRRRPDGEQEAVEEARKAFYAAVETRDQYPREEAGQYTAAELEARRKGEASYDDLPANATERYRSAQAEVDRASRAMDKADRSYFRLNIWGMGRARTMMLALGVVYDDYEERHPEWPDVPDDGYYDWENGEGEHSPEQVAAYQRYDEQRLAVVTWSPEGRQGIPIHKFGSNDGWVVLPQEAFYAAATIRATDPQKVAEAMNAAGITGGAAEWWLDWVDWLDEASKHDGFEVW